MFQKSDLVLQHQLKNSLLFYFENRLSHEFREKKEIFLQLSFKTTVIEIGLKVIVIVLKNFIMERCDYQLKYILISMFSDSVVALT